MPPPEGAEKGKGEAGRRGRGRSLSRERREAAAAEELDDSSELSASDDDSTWISWFTSLRGNEFFCEVDDEFIQVW